MATIAPLPSPPSRFGIKDAVVIGLLVLIGLSVWLKMVQDDRAWRKLGAIEVRLAEVDRRLEELRRVPVGRGGGVGATEPPLVAVQPPTHKGSASSGGANPAAATDSSLPAKPPTQTTREPEAPRSPWPEALGTVTRVFGPFALASDPRAATDAADGAELTELLEIEPRLVTPLFARDTAVRRIVDLVCDPLADVHPQTLVLRGRLAEAWRIDPASKTVRVRLRPGLVFSDGSPLTASDVEWTFRELILNKNVAGISVRGDLAFVESVHAIDDLEVEFTLNEVVFAAEELILTQPVLCKSFYSQYSGEQLSAAPGVLFGSGPFRLVPSEGASTGEYKIGQPVRLERNTRYWGPRPVVGRLRFAGVADAAARLAAFRKGEGELTSPSSAQFAALAADKAFLESSVALSWMTARTGVNAIAWQCAKGKEGTNPLADPRVRRALTMLIDRELVVREFYGGVGLPANGPFNPLSPLTDRQLAPLPFDPRAAMALLESAGWKDRDGDTVIENEKGERLEFAFTFVATEESDRRIAAYLTGQMVNAGIICKEDGNEAAAVGKRSSESNFQAVRRSLSYTVVEPDPFAYWHSSALSRNGAGRNISQWKSPQADAAIEAGRTELDPTKRREHWKKLAAIIAEEQPWTVLRAVPQLYVASKRVGNLHTYPGGVQLVELYVKRAAEPR